MGVTVGAVIWILAVEFFIAQIVVQSAWTTPFSLRHNFISDLGNTVCAPYPAGSQSYVCSPWHGWMNLSFALLGIIILTGAVLVWRAFPAGRMRPVGFALLSIAGLGLMLVGLFPENGNLAFHKLGAAAHFVSGNLGILLLGAGLERGGRRPALATYSVASGAIGLLATFLLVSDRFLGLGVGGMERMAAYPLPLWLIVVGMVFFRSAGEKQAMRNRGTEHPHQERNPS